MEMRAHGGRGPGLGRSLLRQFQVLEHHARGKAAFIAAIGRGGGHLAGNGAIAGQAPALARRLGCDLEKAVRLEAELFG